MAIPQDEPKSPEQVQQWVEKHTREHDRFAHVAAKYDGHLATHGCYDVYPYPNGSLLGTLAATHRARRILEVGCGLGYSALWFAYGAGPGTVVESVERDPGHAAIAIDHFKLKVWANGSKFSQASARRFCRHSRTPTISVISIPIRQSR